MIMIGKNPNKSNNEDEFNKTLKFAFMAYSIVGIVAVVAVGIVVVKLLSCIR